MQSLRGVRRARKADTTPFSFTAMRNYRRVLHVLILLLLAGFGTQTAAEGEPLRIMPLGDSITQGHSASYRQPLWYALRQAGWNIDFVGSMDRYYGGGAPAEDFDPDHEGHWGWFADQVLKRIPDWVAQSDPDVVLLHLGTNDVGSGQDTMETADEVKQIIFRLRQHNSGIHVLLAAIIPVDHALANVRIKEYNAALAGMAATLDHEASRVLLVDQFSGFDPRLDTYDGIHPDDNGNRKMTARWLGALQSLRPQ